MRPVSLGEGGAYSEILRMLLDAGASPFMQRIPPLWERDGGPVSGNVGFTALHYAVRTAWPKPSSRYTACGSIERETAAGPSRRSSLHAAAVSRRRMHAPSARATHRVAFARALREPRLSVYTRQAVRAF